MLNSDMNLITQAFFYEQLQQFEKERAQNRHRRNYSRRSWNVRGRAGSMLIAAGQRLQTLESAHAEPAA